MKPLRSVGAGSWFAWDFYRWVGKGWFRSGNSVDLYAARDGWVVR